MRTPRSVDVEITTRCNLRCRYCYYFNNPAVEYRELPTEEWLRFFDELGSASVMSVTLAGGEPFIREDLTDILDGIVKNRMRFSLLSNGALIDDEIASYIAGTGRCDHVQVSVDGSRAKTHDACRGKGSFTAAIRGIRILQRHGIKAAVRVTIHRYNVMDLDNIARLLLEELGLKAFSTNSAGYLGACRLNADDVMLTTSERQIAMETLLRLNKKYGGRITARAGPLADARMWRRMEKRRARGEPSLPREGRLTSCGCPNNRITVRADGAIVPCSMLAHLVLGWINRDVLQDVWLHHPELNRLRHRKKIPLSNFDFCAECPYMTYCKGGCPGLAYTMTGRVDYPSPDACLRLFLADGGVLPVGFVDTPQKFDLKTPRDTIEAAN